MENRTLDQYALDVYAQRINAEGDFLWGESGAAVSTANLMQEWPVGISDGWGGAIFTWQDYRNAFGNPLNTQIYAQRLSGGGIPGDLWPTSVATTPPAVDLSVRCAPNPTSNVTSISYSSTRAGELRLTIYDAFGRPVRVLRNGSVDVGRHQETWDGRDSQGKLVSTGVYFVLLDSETGRKSSKLLVMR